MMTMIVSARQINLYVRSEMSLCGSRAEQRIISRLEAFESSIHRRESFAELEGL